MKMTSYSICMQLFCEWFSQSIAFQKVLQHHEWACVFERANWLRQYSKNVNNEYWILSAEYMQQFQKKTMNHAELKKLQVKFPGDHYQKQIKAKPVTIVVVVWKLNGEQNRIENGFNVEFPWKIKRETVNWMKN